MLATLGDERLVEQLRRGNDVAFEVMYDRHHRAILSFCRHMLSSQEEAEDAVQHTFISAHGDLVGSDKPIRLKPWLFTIARNRCLSILRARREEAAELDDIPTAGLTHQVQHRDDLRRMLADLRELPEDQRAALVLSELGDLSHAEISEIVGCETLKVKSLVFQARSSLIESRHARETPCEEIREQLATLRGGSLRRGSLRKHVASCPGCSEFREEVRRQRAAMAVLLPVVPSAGLKNGVLAAIGFGGGGAAG
ncbi:MAG: RNA polymerase sigma factor, partial [Actinomycetota bacterium]|nr:RNA polymerase sigma factor [Actinomycetota bacterium]